MQLLEFIEEVQSRVNLTRTDPNFIPPYYGPLMIEAARRKLPWDQLYYNNSPIEYADFLSDTYRLGGLCAWVGPKGELFPLIYGGHQGVRDCFIDHQLYGGCGSTIDNHFAHVSVHDCTIDDSTRNVQNITPKMLNTIYRFMMTVHMLPKAQEQPRDRQPYSWAMPIITEINRNPRFERDIIKPYTSAEWDHMSTPARLINDLAATAYWRQPEPQGDYRADNIKY